MSYEVESLFSIPLFKTNYGKISPEERRTVDKYVMDLQQNTFNYTSNERYILDKDFPELRKFIDQSIVSYVEEVIYGEEYDREKISFDITQSWINLTQPGGNHHIHCHRNSVFSGVFYIQVNEEVDGITFRNNIPEQTIALEPTKYNRYNSPQWRVLVKEGDLLMFPSHLYHSVDVVMTPIPRISLSFNVFPRGTIGGYLDLTELTIN